MGVGSNRTRRIETSVLLIVLALLAVATVADVVRHTRVDHRLNADLHTWRAITGHDYRNLDLEQNIDNRGTREVVCGNTSPGGPKQRVRLCLIMTGPVQHGRRATHGGWYLPPKVDDARGHRYACFGSAKRSRLCGPAPVARKAAA
jgi:hypothetical protein